MTTLCNIGDDILFGVQQEKRLLKHYLQKRHPKIIWNTKHNKYSPFDFQIGDRVFELKARQYYKNRFDKEGHMCEPNKFKYLKDNPNLRGKIYFMYYDGLYVFDATDTEKLQRIRLANGGRDDRGIDDRVKIQAYIRGEDLKLVTRKLKTPKKYYDSDKCLID